MPLNGSPNKPALCADYYEYQMDVGGGPAGSQLRPRSIPMLNETFVPVAALVESFRLEWRTTPLDYFDFRVPDALTAQHEDCARQTAPGQWRVELDGRRAVAHASGCTRKASGTRKSK